MHKHAAKFEVKDVTRTGAFSGYGSVFGNIDGGSDIVAPGAFTKSLSNAAAVGRMPAMLWQHNSDEPIGVWQDMKQDDRGLFVEGKLALKTQRGAEAYELLQLKALNGMSIGYATREDAYDSKTGVRTIKEADLWEVSLVTFPMNDEARVSAVKSIDALAGMTDVERYLRDACGVSRAEARALIAKVKSLSSRDASNDEDFAALVASIKAATATLNAA